MKAFRSRPAAWLAAVALVACIGLPVSLAARDVSAFTDATGAFDPTKLQAFKDFLRTSGIFSPDLLNNPDWVQVAQNLISGILPDFDIVDASGTIVPGPLPGGSFANHAPGQAGCGRVSRLWIRMPFHDCGTYNRKTGKGGCNGSLRLEIPSDAFIPLALGAVQLTAHDPSFNNVEHLENNGFAPSAQFFEAARHRDFNDPTSPILASWADTEILGGTLALYLCGGNGVPFTPGRIDATVPDQPDLLPSPLDSLASNIKAFHRMGLTKLDLVALLGGSHSCAAFVRGVLDSTPTSFDNVWATEALNFVAGKSNLPQCDMVDAANFSQATLTAHPPQARCAAKFVTDLAQPHGPGQLTSRIVQYFSQSNAAFNAQFAASFAKMVRLGVDKPYLPDNFDGYSGDDQETASDMANRRRAWGAYILSRQRMRS